MKQATPKPIILVAFDCETVVWKSAGWKKDTELMKLAKKTINEAETPEQVIEHLMEAGFTVVFEPRTS